MPIAHKHGENVLLGLIFIVMYIILDNHIIQQVVNCNTIQDCKHFYIIYIQHTLIKRTLKMYTLVVYLILIQ